MEGHFGFKVGIELEDKGEKLLSDLKQPDYIKAKETMARQQRRIRALEAKEVETRGKLGALTDEVEEKRSQAADIGLKVDEKTIELDGLRDEIEQKALDLAAAKAECEVVSQKIGVPSATRRDCWGRCGASTHRCRDWALGSCGQGWKARNPR